MQSDPLNAGHAFDVSAGRSRIETRPTTHKFGSTSIIVRQLVNAFQFRFRNVGSMDGGRVVLKDLEPGRRSDRLNYSVWHFSIPLVEGAEVV